ncbi:EamA family transporter RarD [Pseudohoeflea coraliihabitans]|uniref:EamA family transporter RarD n=1 Tax=Pseudohoeflea coraliihabitans TaxID=2860393 RepID=A0ABS6WPJ8_9HYPH|nr:EamA family transporter RarD [Pseudohoeflea sp. DP4N28-3]MBW3097894.1 EamA family transporter RarD [Pseudohoeflea sp. DP4N28-3]
MPPEDQPRGIVLALIAYVIWGLLAVYMKAVAHIPVLEVLAHRALWSVPLTAAFLLWLGRTRDVRAALRTPKSLAMAALTASLVTVNWGVYVWAISVDRAVETALGYYINPLFSIFLAAVLLREKLDRLQVGAIAIAVVAVAVMAWEMGGVPWISLTLALSWGFYAFFRKTLPIGPTQGFFLEILLLSVPALIYVSWQAAHGAGHFGPTGARDVLLLLGCGLVTAVPLLFYAHGAKLIRLSTIGIMQYIAPTLIFLIAIFVFREPFGLEKLMAFVLIWTALALYSVSLLRQHRARHRDQAAPLTSGQ